MKKNKNKNKNYTMYWMFMISAILTIPISMIILKRIHAGNVAKTLMILAVFIVFFIFIMLLYKFIFGVSVQEITGEEKLTELDRLSSTLTEFRKKYYNVTLKKCIDQVKEQIERFKRRKNVMFEIAGGDFGSTSSGTLADLVQTVEDAILIHIERIINRIEIFDDKGIPDIVRQNIEYIDEQINQTNIILMEFETLITETSRMGETHDDKDISKLWDVVNAMKSLRTNQNDDLDELAKKYDKESK